MLTYLSGISGPKRQAKKTARVEQKAKRKEIKQVSRQARLTSAGKFAVKSGKSILSKTPAGLVAARIKKAAVEGQKRRAFKKAGEPIAVSPSQIFAEPQEIQNAEIEFEQGEQEIDTPEFENSDSMESQDDMGIIYPGTAFNGAKGKARKVARKQKKSSPAGQAKKTKRQETIKKIGAGALSVAKATLEAKGIKFPSKEQIETEATQTEKPSDNFFAKNKMLLIGGAVVLIGGMFLLKKKK